MLCKYVYIVSGNVSQCSRSYQFSILCSAPNWRALSQGIFLYASKTIQFIPPRKFVSARLRHTHILRVIIQLCNAHNYARDYFLRMDKYEPHNFHQFGNEQSMKPGADWPLNVVTLYTKPNLIDACLFVFKTCLQSN